LASDRPKFGYFIDHRVLRGAKSLFAIAEVGVSREIAKKIRGHKSDSMWARYRICPDRDLRQALERTQLYREGTTWTVVSIAK
jgi:hypothetical protein